VTDQELADTLESLIDKPLMSAAAAPGLNVLMLCFPEGKTLYVSGDNLKIELEAAS